MNIEFRNPNISGKNLKGGMKYELKVEILEEDFDKLRRQELEGAYGEIVLSFLGSENDSES